MVVVDFEVLVFVVFVVVVLSDPAEFALLVSDADGPVRLELSAAVVSAACVGAAP